MKYINYVAQVDEADCGVAALAMILKHFKFNVSLAKLRLMARTTKEGTTAFGLARAAEQMGIEVDAYQADLDFLRKQQPKFPAIVHVIKAGLLHYYVVFNLDQEFVYIADPDPKVKVKRMSVAEFEQQWSGVCLFFYLTDQYQPQQQSEPTFGMVFKSLLNYKRLIAQVVSVAILMTLISVVGSYYLQLLIDTIIPRQTLNLLS
ncbi:MAG: cysteine peptidase family C39 domain-containing protein, partial [Limosilactobacillus sp.]|nr:cysteine peptidase family C39 domain-containing protein [Limosilactobacillus sp.]